MKKELIDQAAHFAVGAALVAVLSLVTPHAAAFLLMMLAATAREVVQHGGFDFGRGTALDLGFFALGGGVAWLIG